MSFEGIPRATRAQESDKERARDASLEETQLETVLEKLLERNEKLPKSSSVGTAEDVHEQEFDTHQYDPNIGEPSSDFAEVISRLKERR